MLKEKSCQPRILYPKKLSFASEGEIKSFPDVQKLREFITTKPFIVSTLYFQVQENNEKNVNNHMWVRAKLLQSCPTFCDPMDCSLPGPLSLGFSRQEYWSGLHVFLQGIFLTQGSNPCLLWLLHCRQIYYCQATREAPIITYLSIRNAN